MDWLYVWSPRYRFFHEFLFSSIYNLTGFHVQPVFAEQHFFTRIDSASTHFLGGIPIKIHVIINYIKQNMGKFFFFTDVDLIVLPNFSIKDLEFYKQYDITTMKEPNNSMIQHNIGCLLIRCCPETLAFFQRVEDRIRKEKLLDQDAFHQEVSSFTGSIGIFSEEEYLQSNMLSTNTENYKIIQCLTSLSDPTDILYEKVLTIMSAYDISQIQHYLPEDVQEILRTETGMRES